MESSETPDELDTLKIYGYSFDFPAKARLEFNPKFEREAGDVAIKQAGARVFVTWGSLGKLPEKVRSTEDHAAYSVGRVKGSTRRKVESLEHRTVEVNGHQAVLNEVKVEAEGRSFLVRGAREEEALSLHVHCDASGRYFVVFAAINEGNRDQQTKTFDLVLSSLKCH